MLQCRLLDFVVEVAKEDPAVIERIMYRFNNDDIINNRYWLIFSILSGGVRDNVATAHASSIALDIDKHIYAADHESLVINHLCCKKNNNVARYRFPHRGASAIHSSLLTLERYGNSFSSFIAADAISSRDNVVKAFKGVGLKQASLLLRNIFASFDCCVVDTHIVKFLYLIGAVPKEFLGTTMTRRRYFSIEVIFKSISSYIGLPLALLDHAVWRCMRYV